MYFSKITSKNSTEKIRYQRLKLCPKRMQFWSKKSSTNGKITKLYSEYTHDDSHSTEIESLNESYNMNPVSTLRNECQNKRSVIHSQNGNMVLVDHNKYKEKKSSINHYPNSKPQFENAKLANTSSPEAQIQPHNTIYTIPIREYIDLPESRNNNNSKRQSSQTFSTITTTTGDMSTQMVNVRNKNISTKQRETKNHVIVLSKQKIKKMNWSKVSARMKQCYDHNAQ